MRKIENENEERKRRTKTKKENEDENENENENEDENDTAPRTLGPWDLWDPGTLGPTNNYPLLFQLLFFVDSDIVYFKA